jgi:hypothetical protein
VHDTFLASHQGQNVFWYPWFAGLFADCDKAFIADRDGAKSGLPIPKLITRNSGESSERTSASFREK